MLAIFFNARLLQHLYIRSSNTIFYLVLISYHGDAACNFHVTLSNNAFSNMTLSSSKSKQLNIVNNWYERFVVLFRQVLKYVVLRRKHRSFVEWYFLYIAIYLSRFVAKFCSLYSFHTLIPFMWYL